MPDALNEIHVLIPAYNEVETIRALAERALRMVPNVVVVDDGSQDGTAAQLAGLPVTLLRNERNIGKAASLWRGFEHALARGARRLVALEADATASPEAIGRVLYARVLCRSLNWPVLFEGASERGCVGGWGVWSIVG